MMTQKKNQLGLSLVELLVAMALGLLLTVGGLQMMLSSQNLYRTTDSLSRIQESGRFALNFLAKDIRMAGYESDNLVAFFDDPCGGFNPCTADGGGAISDRIAVMLTPSQATDCIGNAVTSYVVNVYYLRTVNNVSSLYCRGYDSDTGTWNGAEQPLVDGVENLQILYGIKSNGGEIEQYSPANIALDYENVGTVRIALLINNGQALGSGETANRTFTLLDAPQQAFTDKHVRQIYTSTITVNNAIYPTVPES